jgi:MFS family permease
MPLAPHGTSDGLPLAAFSLSGVLAPFLGSWADRTGRHRDLLIWGTFGAGLPFMMFDVVSAPLRTRLAAGAGLGAVAATTAGCDRHSRDVARRLRFESRCLDAGYTLVGGQWSRPAKVIVS